MLHASRKSAPFRAALLTLSTRLFPFPLPFGHVAFAFSGILRPLGLLLSLQSAYRAAFCKTRGPKGFPSSASIRSGWFRPPQYAGRHVGCGERDSGESPPLACASEAFISSFRLWVTALIGIHSSLAMPPFPSPLALWILSAKKLFLMQPTKGLPSLQFWTGISPTTGTAAYSCTDVFRKKPLLVAAPGPHRACGFPRTRRSTGPANRPARGHSSTPITGASQVLPPLLALAQLLIVLRQPIAYATQRFSPFRQLYLCMYAFRRLLWASQLSCACNAAWPFIAGILTQPLWAGSFKPQVCSRSPWAFYRPPAYLVPASPGFAPHSAMPHAGVLGRALQGVTLSFRPSSCQFFYRWLKTSIAPKLFT